MAAAHVLLSTADGVPATRFKHIRLPLGPRDTVAELKRRVRAFVGAGVAVGSEVDFLGQRLQDSEEVFTAGIPLSASKADQWAGQLVYPNGWFLFEHRKALAKIGRRHWPPKEQSSSSDWRYLLGLLLVFVSCNWVLK